MRLIKGEVRIESVNLKSNYLRILITKKTKIAKRERKKKENERRNTDNDRIANAKELIQSSLQLRRHAKYERLLKAI